MINLSDILNLTNSAPIAVIFTVTMGLIYLFGKIINSQCPIQLNSKYSTYVNSGLFSVLYILIPIALSLSIITADKFQPVLSFIIHDRIAIPIILGSLALMSVSVVVGISDFIGKRKNQIIENQSSGITTKQFVLWLIIFLIDLLLMALLFSRIDIFIKAIFITIVFVVYVFVALIAFVLPYVKIIVTTEDNNKIKGWFIEIDDDFIKVAISRKKNLRLMAIPRNKVKLIELQGAKTEVGTQKSPKSRRNRNDDV